MKRLRHPVRAIREPFGTAGLVVACVALIAALAGGAYAASGALTAKQKKEVKKIAKQFAGKPGAPGATGPAGPAGAKGDTGAAGAAGKDGTNGTNGTNGVNGVSPTGTAFTGEQNGCKAGGVKIVGANTTVVCNGETGFTKTLPPGETETGTWAFGVKGPADLEYVPISLNIPLEAAPTVYVIRATGQEKQFPSGTEVSQPNCPGTAEEPAAKPGALCVYMQSELNVGLTYAPILKSYKSGAVIPLVTSGGSSAWGTFAVQAPPAP